MNILTITGLIWCSLWELNLKIWVPITFFWRSRLIKALPNHLEFTPAPNPLNHLATMCGVLILCTHFSRGERNHYASQIPLWLGYSHIIWVLPVPADFLKCGCRMKQDEVIAVWINHPLCKQCPKVSASSSVAPPPPTVSKQLLTALWCGGHCCWGLCPEGNILAWFPQLWQGLCVIKQHDIKPFKKTAWICKSEFGCWNLWLII